MAIAASKYALLALSLLRVLAQGFVAPCTRSLSPACMHIHSRTPDSQTSLLVAKRGSLKSSAPKLRTHLLRKEDVRALIRGVMRFTARLWRGINTRLANQRTIDTSSAPTRRTESAAIASLSTRASAGTRAKEPLVDVAEVADINSSPDSGSESLDIPLEDDFRLLQHAQIIATETPKAKVVQDRLQSMRDRSEDRPQKAWRRFAPPADVSPAMQYRAALPALDSVLAEFAHKYSKPVRR